MASDSTGDNQESFSAPTATLCLAPSCSEKNWDQTLQQLEYHYKHTAYFSTAVKIRIKDHLHVCTCDFSYSHISTYHEIIVWWKPSSTENFDKRSLLLPLAVPWGQEKALQCYLAVGMLKQLEWWQCEQLKICPKNTVRTALDMKWSSNFLIQRYIY